MIINIALKVTNLRRLSLIMSKSTLGIWITEPIVKIDRVLKFDFYPYEIYQSLNAAMAQPLQL